MHHPSPILMKFTTVVGSCKNINNKILKRNLGQVPVKIYDGCASQYKNCKHFLNLCHHEQDFGMSAEWNFFATSHGKGACDGVGGTVKTFAAKASMHRPHDHHINTPMKLFEFASFNIPAIKFCFSTTEGYYEEATLLASRMQRAKTIAGTQKLHFVKPLSLNHLEVAM